MKTSTIFLILAGIGAAALLYFKKGTARTPAPAAPAPVAAPAAPRTATAPGQSPSTFDQALTYVKAAPDLIKGLSGTVKSISSIFSSDSTDDWED